MVYFHFRKYQIQVLKIKGGQSQDGLIFSKMLLWKNLPNVSGPLSNKYISIFYCD